MPQVRKKGRCTHAPAEADEVHTLAPAAQRPSSGCGGVCLPGPAWSHTRQHRPDVGVFLPWCRPDRLWRSNMGTINIRSNITIIVIVVIINLHTGSVLIILIEIFRVIIW